MACGLTILVPGVESPAGPFFCSSWPTTIPLQTHPCLDEEKCSADTLAAGLFQKGAFGFRRTANGTGACFQTSVCLTFCTCFCASPFRMGETYWATGTVEFLCPCVWNALNAFFSGGLSESPKVSKRGLWGGSNYIQAPAGLLQWGHLVFGRTAGGTKRRYVSRFCTQFFGHGRNLLD